MEPLQPADPQVVGRYRLVGRLGSGGMGRVYLGTTPEGRQAAVKVIRDDLAGDTAFRARFRREVSAAVSVAGLFTARVLDADPDDDPPWLATQYVQGPSLRDAVMRDGPLPAVQLGPLAQGLAQGLGSIHAAGLVHRDLKPANVLLSPDGPKVIDFGIARGMGTTQLTGTGELIGTPEYMAPEQVAGADVGPAADVFALGSTIVFAATGRSPFAADQAAATLYRIMQLEPDLDGVPAWLVDVVRACLAKSPGTRPTAQQLAVRLRTQLVDVRTAETLPGGDPNDLTVPRPGPIDLAAPSNAGRPRRRGIVAAVAAGVLVVVAGGGTALGLTLAARDDGRTVITTSPSASAAPATAASTVRPAVDPNDPKVRYVDRLCAAGELLTTIADAFTGTTVSGDPAVARKEFLTSTDRSIGVVDTALADLVPLRDEAPTPQIGLQFGQMVTEFTKAREAFSDARARVAAVEPLTADAYAAGVDRFTDGVRNLALAATLQQGITLPVDYTAVADAAPHCRK